MLYLKISTKKDFLGKRHTMKKIIYLVLFLFLASCGSDKTASLSTQGPSEITPLSSKISAQSVLSKMEKGRYREGELLVKFRDGVAVASSVKTHQGLGSALHRRYVVVPNLDHVRLSAGVSVRDAVIKYMADPNVEYAEPNYIKRASAIPNDPHFNLQWGLTAIKAPQAWDVTTGSNSVIVAFVDSGIDSTHPDLAANVVPGRNFVVNPDTADTTDDNGHGTHVSGIAGAVGNNGTGVTGVMWNVKLMPVKFLDATGGGDVSGEISAIEFAVAHGAKVINASFSGPDFSQFEYDAISSANTAGVLLMAAAGNDGTSDDQFPNYPANYNLPNILSVTATDQSDSLASFSDFGNSVHVAAPGEDIFSTYPPGSYAFISGTSMSTAFVTGLAGLLYSYYTNFTYSQIRGTILRYVDVLPSLNGKIMTGGRINAYKALSSLLTPTNLSASATSQGQNSLTWTDNATGEDGYKVERKIGGGAFSQIAAIAANTTAFTDGSTADGATATYRVRAVNSLPNPPSSAQIEANSSYSNEASVTTPLNPPTGLTATNATSTSVTLVWTDNSQSEQGYRIEEKAPGGSFVQIAETGANSTSFTVSGLNSSTTYSFRVRAFSAAAGNSQYSNESSVTTPSSGGGGGSSPSTGGGGGGGCSVGVRQNSPTALADCVVLVMPLLLIAILRRRR
jgi:subtilisin family serine protease